jgi:uncharacterized protein
MICTSIVLKVASRCNLNCTYCYVYNKGNDNYKLQPKIMKKETVIKLLEKIKEHCQKYKLDSFLIVFHGGEPLLAGIDFFNTFVELYKNIYQDSDITLKFTMQSNGVLLNDELTKNLKNLNIQIGISIDGTKKSNNDNRIFHNGNGSYTDILNGFNSVKKIFGSSYANCLCVIDVNEKPIEVYEHFKKIEVNNLNLLFPDFTIDDKQNGIEIPNLGEWLIEMYDIWDADRTINKISPFAEITGLILGIEECGSEAIGKRENKTIVIETNGNIEAVDTLKICENNFTKTTLNIFNNNLNDIYSSNSLATEYYLSHENLCKKCSNCDLEEICGGGFIAHRYSSINRFDNPTVYCEDLAKLICHIQNKLYEDLPENIASKIEKLNYNEIYEYIQS